MARRKNIKFKVYPQGSPQRDDSQMEELLTNLTESQLELLNKFMNSSERSMIVDGRYGGLVSSLSELNLLQKRGRIGRAFKWQVNSDLFRKEDRELIRELVR